MKGLFSAPTKNAEQKKSRTSVGDSLGLSGAFSVISYDSSSHKTPEDARAAKRASSTLC